MKECELIEVIDRMSLTERFQTALELAASCLNYVDSAGAVNLIGRILHEVSEDEELFSALKPVIEKNIADRVFVKIPLKVEACSDIQKCSAVAEQFFLTAAKLGYVYASNNLAVREAERIVAVSRENKEDPSIGESISRYIEYLKLSADKYEPYAANRLGLFYITGEVRGISGSYSDRSYIDTALAKEYFIRATVYPNENSAWAFFNLIKYFHKDYDNNLELLNEHMDYIKVLNPKVYDIAIEL